VSASHAPPRGGVAVAGAADLLEREAVVLHEGGVARLLVVGQRELLPRAQGPPRQQHHLQRLRVAVPAVRARRRVRVVQQVCAQR
jgi:hypothetical protein